MKMYLYIYDDGSIIKGSHPTETNFLEAEEGVVDIINIQEPNYPTYYSGGEWLAISDTFNFN